MKVGADSLQNYELKTFIEKTKTLIEESCIRALV